uniref:Homeobox domain-containing protein n=2 Tax=Rhinopithecus TaxID=542827 RepID=A0A2K6MFC9_RHIBE
SGRARWLIPVIPALLEAEEDLFIQKQPAMPWDQNPEQSNGNYSENEQKGEQKWREGGGEAGGKREREKEEENEKELEDEQEKRKRENKKKYSKGRLVSKSLMDTLWAKFKLNRCPTIQESLSLSFEFGMTHKQISQWFCKKRKKYNREMSKRKHKEKQTR